MADLSDITAFLVTSATTAVYPNGTSQPSIAAMDINLGEGWPNPSKIDLDVAGKMLDTTVVPNATITRPGGPLANVTVFPLPGNNVIPYQVLNETYTIISPTYGIVLSVVGQVITFSGTPHVGEYVSIIADGQYAYSETGASAAAIISALAADFSANYTGVSSTSSTLTIPFGHSLTVRQGGQGVLGRVTHRQRQSVMVTVWAPTHTSRTTIAAAVDNYIKQNIRVTMPDSSQAIITYNRTNVSDEQQMATIYRRDLIYDCEYATVEQFTGFVVTIASTQITATSNGLTSSPVIALT